MKNLLLLFAIPLFFISCVRDNDGDNKIGETVSLNLDLSLSFTLEKTGESNKGVGLTNKFSEFNHIFKDEVDLVFTSTTTDFTTTLTITPNDLSNTPTLVIPYGTYSWSIAKETFDYENDDYFRSYLSIFGSGQVEIYSSDVSLDLVVDTNYSLVTVEKENVSSAKLILDPPLEKDLVLRGNYYYLYAFSFTSEYGSLENRGYALEVKESVYDTTLLVAVGDNKTFYSNTHYNYILAFSDVDVNSITLKTAAFEQIDYYLQPTATVSSTCVISGSIRGVDQFNEVSFTMTASSTLPADIVFDFTTTCSETLNVIADNLPEGLTVTDYNSTFKTANLTGVVSATASGTYNYTITAFNSDNLNTATASGTVTGTIIVTGLNPIYLDENGVTIKAYDWANVGSKGIINGVEYTIVDEATLREMVSSIPDVTKLVTTKVTDMNYLFRWRDSFNQDISSWDVSNVTNMSNMFNGNPSQQVKTTHTFNQDISSWDVSNVTDMTQMFGNSQFNQDIGSWDVSNVTRFDNMFNHSLFNQDIGSWDVSNGIRFTIMFGNSQFNQDIGSWDISNADSLEGMFWNSSFNQDIGSWDTSNVTSMIDLFKDNFVFNQDISNWDTSKVTSMRRMFSYSYAFNQDISAWNTSNVTDMSAMFMQAKVFNQDISNWDTSKVTNMGYMFVSALVFNQNISSWDTSNVTTMISMFSSAAAFNQDISNWDTSNVTDMRSMLSSTSFNQDISSWNTSLVADMAYLFSGTPFNQDISNWDTSKVTDMDEMFRNCSSFNQDLSGWCVDNISSEPSNFSLNSALENSNKPVWGTCPQ